MEAILNNLLMIAVLVFAAIIIWKISKTVIHMVIGFVLLVGIAIGIWYVYQVGLHEISTGSGYLVVFIKGAEILIERLKEAML